MTPATTFAGRSVALFGLGGSGLATALSLKAGGASVVACDDNPDSMAHARARGIATGDLRTADWSGFAALILSPGVPLTHPAPHWTVERARAAGIAIIGDIELFCRERRKVAPGSPFVAITGTNGKSTTTALVAHVLRHAGWDVQMGGNIGTAILSLEPPAPNRVHVIELSSFQIDLTPSLDPSIGILLNITPDHLDRHGTMENYAAIKERLVAGAHNSVVGVDDSASAAIQARAIQREADAVSCRERIGRQYPVSVERPLPMGYSLDGTRILARPYGDVVRVLGDVDGLSTLRGQHNWQNACFAAAVADLFEIYHGEEDEVGGHARLIQEALRTFPGLPHRMEEVGRRGRVVFVNDSKATNADSTEKALSAFHDVHWILGGKPKEGGIAPLAPLFPRVAHAYLIGAAADAFAATLEGVVPFTRCGTLDVATSAAAAAAAASDAPEPVVLLSPACASYDQFKSFEDRGDQFRALVRGLNDRQDAQRQG